MPFVLSTILPNSFFGLPLYIGVEIILGVAVLNKISGFYGILSLFTGHPVEALQWLFYISSILMIPFYVIGLRNIKSPKLKTFSLVSLVYCIDTICAILFILLFSFEWFSSTDQDSASTSNDGNSSNTLDSSSSKSNTGNKVDKISGASDKFSDADNSAVNKGDKLSSNAGASNTDTDLNKGSSSSSGSSGSAADLNEKISADTVEDPSKISSNLKTKPHAPPMPNLPVDEQPKVDSDASNSGAKHPSSPKISFAKANKNGGSAPSPHEIELADAYEIDKRLLGFVKETGTENLLNYLVARGSDISTQSASKTYEMTVTLMTCILVIIARIYFTLVLLSFTRQLMKSQKYRQEGSENLNDLENQSSFQKFIRKLEDKSLQIMQGVLYK